MHVDVIMVLKWIKKHVYVHDAKEVKRSGIHWLNLMNWKEVDELSAASSTTFQVLTGSNSLSLIQSLIEPFKKKRDWTSLLSSSTFHNSLNPDLINS